MTPLVDRAPRLSSEDAVRIALEIYGLEVTAAPLPSERDQNFRLRDSSGAEYVLKVANSEESREILDLQTKALQHVAAGATGLRWPRIVASRDGEEMVEVAGHLVRLLTWVEGVCLAEALPHDGELLASLGTALARTGHALQSFSHPAASRTFYWDVAQAGMARAHLPLLPPGRRGLLEPIFAAWEQIPWDSLPASVIYGDANDYNVLVEDGRVCALLDFGDMVRTATVCDLAIAIAYVMLDKADPIAAAAYVVEAYHSVRPLSDVELDALFPLAAARLAMSVCYAAFQFAHAPKNDYLNISNAPAWKLLERLAGFPSGWPTEVFHHVCRPAPDLLAARHRNIGPSLSVSYDQPLHIVRGWKQHLYSSTGRAYLDCVNNVAHVGHCHPAVTRAAAAQMARLNTNTRYLYDQLSEYAARLTATLPDPLRVVYFVCSGSEANELALRLARAHTGRDGVIVVDTAYHGNTSALVDISPYKFNGPGGRGCPPHVQVVPMPDLYRAIPYAGTVAAAAAGRTAAAFICESALGCGGQIILPEGYLADAFEAARHSGAVCIADEVQTGFGRAGSHFWMFETQSVIPDIVTMGKPIGNGHPMGAVVTTPEIAASFANGMEYFNTFGGNPVSCAVGITVLDVIREEGLQENARDTGEYLLAGLNDLAATEPLIGDVRGHGLFLGVELVRDRETKEPAAAEAARLVNRMKEHGILLSTDGPYHNVIKIKPPIVFNRQDADFLLHHWHSE
ncbi:MAG TPA: aminotransferase class III-fold pyridoxal phosphate-dependent enzyme [Candidatus Sulfopaludibacter sp.]|jgi:4-aminobutyrate aminotransferase-like enzyme|nr:aminotransferase class III-fold pyridoxal phosphate-dependent enzyme [Candidatus Sulfopaludibacter sp.]